MAAAKKKKKTKASTGVGGKAKAGKAAAGKKPAAKKSAAKKPAARKAAVKKATAKKKIPAKKKAIKKVVAKKPGPTADNRRRFDRRETQIAAELEHDGRKTAGAVTNLSLQGCLFAPPLKLKPGSRVKLKLSGESKPVSATVKAVSAQGVHCLLHAGGATLSRLSTDLDDMALLMLSAGRPTSITKTDGK